MIGLMIHDAEALTSIFEIVMKNKIVIKSGFSSGLFVRRRWEQV